MKNAVSRGAGVGVGQQFLFDVTCQCEVTESSESSR